MKPRISMVTLGVRDLWKSIAFYEDGLGFPRMDSPPGVAFFTLKGTWLGLYGRISSGWSGYQLYKYGTTLSLFWVAGLMLAATSLLIPFTISYYLHHVVKVDKVQSNDA